MNGFGLRPVDGINALILLMVVWILVRVINDPSNTIIVADFVSTRGADGRQHGDINKLGQCFGIFVCVVTVMMFADNDSVNPVGMAALLAAALAFLAAPSMYASFLRSKQGSIETTKVTEPADPPMKTTVSKIETPPITAKQ